ncbi:hypothetical protein, partial [Weeksella sp. HMSC059D05]|uniref:hypothetical protein n=1 Tax=Weeksella sp. HMSC059D05 TaxID=1715139 RepID=UPI00143B39B3
TVGVFGGFTTIGKQDQKNNCILSKTSFAMKDNSCVLEVTINYQEGEDREKAENAPVQTKTIDIDMSKIIRIDSNLVIADALMGFDSAGIGHFDRGWVLTFVLVDENYKETQKIELLQFNNGFSTNNDFYQLAEAYKTTNPYKVLNHLRKLCNAPEPLSWD